MKLRKLLIEQETIEQEQFAKIVADVVPLGKTPPMGENEPIDVAPVDPAVPAEVA